MSNTITEAQKFWWRIALELKLRKCSGDAFQDFFSTMMAKVHGADYVRVRPYGKLGDKGCDGYVQSSGQVFQCYGAINGDSGKVDYLVGKMHDDYKKAVEAIPSIMREWYMVHNLVDGLPIHAVEAIKQLELEDSERKFGFIGMEAFEERIFSLGQHQIEDLLGVVATNQDAQNLQPVELRDLVAGVAAAADQIDDDFPPIRPVPPAKLEFNQLPGHWRKLIAGGWQNAHLVSTYLGRHPNPLTGEQIARFFRARYAYFKAQQLLPGAIMSKLYETVTGITAVTPARQIAAQALLAFLFESCDIFEDDPAKVSK